MYIKTSLLHCLHCTCTLYIVQLTDHFMRNIVQILKQRFIASSVIHNSQDTYNVKLLLQYIYVHTSKTPYVQYNVNYMHYELRHILSTIQFTIFYPTLSKIELSLYTACTIHCTTANAVQFVRIIIPNLHITTDQTVFLYSRFNFKNTSLKITLNIVNSPDVTRTMNKNMKRIIN